MNRFKISNFGGGLNQSVDDSAMSVNESKDAQNVDISNGDLRTIKGFSKYIATAVGAPVTRLMKFYKTNTTTGVTTSYLLAATASAIYYWNGSAWTSLATGLTNGDWDYLNYQIADTDVVIMGNGSDVMKKWDGSTFANLGGTPPVAKSLSIHAERLWATGVKAFPNSAYYSDDLDPENWTGGEDASGEIYLPTWDGGICIGVSTIFSDLVIFKTNNIYRVLGTYPSVYEVKEVYSAVGAIAEKTIVSSNDRAFFMSKDGLYYYNGVSAYPLLGDKLKEVVINATYAQNAVSIVYKNKLYCAFPEGVSTTNNAVIVYDILRNTVMLWRGVSATDFIEYDDKLLFTNANGYVYRLDGTTLNFDGTAISAYWETPWQGLDSLNMVKSADTLYFYASGTADGVLTITASFDSKTKTKTVKMTAAGKTYSVPLNMEGRRFKLKFANTSGSDFILKSPELTYEADED
jgi:hypothetical protein